MSKNISTVELRTLIQGQSDFLLLDVLKKEQFAKDHIEGARNVPAEGADFLPAVAKAAGAKSKKIVVYCADASCSASRTSAEKLAVAGYTDVATYKGGLAAWRRPEAIAKPAEATKASKPTKAKSAEASAAATVRGTDADQAPVAKGRVSS